MTKEVIAVTGSTGFVGRHLISSLQDKDVTLRVLIRNNESEVVGAKNIVGDLETGKGLEELLQGANIVINLVGRMQSSFKDLVSLNATVLDNLCLVATKSRVKKLIHVSAAAVYGQPVNNNPFTEDDTPMPDTPYSLSKLMGEQVLSFYYRDFSLPIIILRPPNIYGPGSDHGVVYNLIKSAKETGGVTIHGDGTQQRDFLYVGDFIDAIIKCLDYKGSGDVFNIATSDPKTLNELVKILAVVMKKELNITYEGQAQGARLVSASFKKAERLLNWKPWTNLEEGLKRTLESA